MSIKNYQEKFKSILTSLNARQLEAVKQTEGPVMVLAGPGTGKTQVLAARIANILLSTDTQADNILCLTYTDAGTVAMRKRLQEFIGPDAYRINISTFHGFCNMVIQENLDVFGYRNLDPVSDLEQVQFLRQIVDNLPKSHPLKRYTGDVYFEIPRLLNLFSILKKEDWTPDHILPKIEEYCNSLPDREQYQYKRSGKKKDGTSYQKGDIKTELIQEELRKMEQLRAGVALFEPYQDVLRKNSRYDFSDMILWVIKAFEDDPVLLASYQEKYLYILVDEFQDTSGSQNDLLSLLLGYWDVPNIFAVGDDDQSIYRFQGANIENIQSFITTYSSHLKLVTLTDNYRSTQTILDTSSGLIGKNEQRISNEKNLVAGNWKYNTGTFEMPVITEYVHPLHESAEVAEKITTLLNQGVKAGEIAVLYRNHQQAEEIANNLRSQNIQVNTRRRMDILQEPIIRKIILVLQYLKAENEQPHKGEPYLFQILHFTEFDIPTLEIARISVELARRNFNERQGSWREEIASLASKKQTDLFEQNTLGVSIRKFSNLIEHLIKESINVTVQECINLIIRECGLLATALKSSNRNWQMEVLQTFFDFIKTECAKNPNYKLTDIINLLLLMEENLIALPAEKIMYAEEGVNFITAHSSKGLEFDYVFIIGCNSRQWDKSAGNRTYKLPDNLFSLPTADESEESRRLFYVAMTRARLHLEMSYSRQDLNQKELEHSRFIAEICETSGLKINRPAISETNQINFIVSQSESNEAGIPESIVDNAFTDSLLEKYSLSVTHLNAYLKCPVAFYFNNFLKVPAPRSASMTFGSAVHYALEQLFKKMNQDEEKKFPGQEVFIKDFRWFMKRNMDSFIEAEYKRRLEYGEEILPRYYEKYVNVWNKITSVEKPYRNVVVRGIPLNGKLDKLEFTGNEVNVVDYKTGAYKNARNKFKRPDAEAVSEAETAGKEPLFEDQYGGDYWRQAVFYKILMDNDTQKNWEMRSSEFDFIEPLVSAGENGKNEYTFHKEKVVITHDDIKQVESQIEFVYESIRKKEFTKGCNDPDCHWCNFTKDYYSGRKGMQVIPAEKDSELEE